MGMIGVESSPLVCNCLENRYNLKIGIVTRSAKVSEMGMIERGPPWLSLDCSWR